jgi:cytoskeleton protein RodZ
VLRAKSDSWVEVRDPQSNSLLVARLLRAGDVYNVPDKPGLRLVTGNAGGLVVLVDGASAPPLGKEGAVRRGIALDPDTLRRGPEGGTTQ